MLYGYGILLYVVFILFLYIKFPVVFIGAIALSLIFIGYLSIFGYRIPCDTELWKDGSPD
jgi:hypothetical protein